MSTQTQVPFKAMELIPRCAWLGFCSLSDSWISRDWISGERVKLGLDPGLLLGLRGPKTTALPWPDFLSMPIRFICIISNVNRYNNPAREVKHNYYSRIADRNAWRNGGSAKWSRGIIY